jgi:hypothetical protein
VYVAAGLSHRPDRAAILDGKDLNKVRVQELMSQIDLARSATQASCGALYRRYDIDADGLIMPPASSP